MPFGDPEVEAPSAASPLSAFLALAGAEKWRSRVRDIGVRARPGSLSGRAAQQRHALELILARLNNPAVLARAGRHERRVLAFVREATELAAVLEPGPRARLQQLIGMGLEGEGNLIPLFHLLRTAALLRLRGFEVRHDGLLHGTPYDLMVQREGAVAEVVCETVSAEEGRPLHRGHWASLVDRVNPELQTWLAAHPGRYILKMTLPEDVSEKNRIGELHGRICAMLAAEKRQDASADAVLKLDPLVLAGAQAASDPTRALPARLRELFGLEAHLAVTADPASGSVMVMAARAGRENDIATAAKRRLAQAATARLSGRHPGLLALFLDDLDAAEWHGLRDTLELEGVVRRFLTEAEAKPVVAVTCATRQELFGLPDCAPEGELRFRNPSHPQSRSQGLEPAISSAGD
ncbi:hypothetical protein [Roseococcus suduntuyensis]|uniref:Uncharacterized protein n=1 Tax=Roseococcus suduntuyensis TaxID=455361 RepID=A0A840AFR7_9PROT|nr:hypothetical protein [Roseococcus suduntuyensis]MBB3899897.1 hypothetical protein [Roseococcus suduntuyensis]